MTIKLYIAKHCPPCQEVKELIKAGKFFSDEELKVIDVETDEGFAEFSHEVLDYGDSEVPSAYREGTKCRILIADDGLMFDCSEGQDTLQ